MAVSGMNSVGHYLVLDDKGCGSYVVHRRTGRWHRVYKKDGVYILPVWIKRTLNPKPSEPNGLIEENAHFGRQPI